MANDDAVTGKNAAIYLPFLLRMHCHWSL